LEFIENLQSPLIFAYKNFLNSWKPEEEVENKWLLGLGKDYQKSGFAFCLSGNPECLLHEESAVKKKWEEE
jgi:CRISPR-associated protein Csd1